MIALYNLSAYGARLTDSWALSISKQKIEQMDVMSLNLVYEEKGYNPIDQLVGYLLSGDPTYITSHDDARTKLRRFERYELIEELVVKYLEKNTK